MCGKPTLSVYKWKMPLIVTVIMQSFKNGINDFNVTNIKWFNTQEALYL